MLPCVHHAVVFRLRCWIRLYPLSSLLPWPTLSCSIRLDSLLSPLLRWLTRRCPLSLLLNTHARELLDAPLAVSTSFSVAASMVRCVGVWHGCVRVLGVPIACPVAMIVVRRRFQEHIVARTRVWRDMTGDRIGYNFEYTMRTAALHFGLDG